MPSFFTRAAGKIEYEGPLPSEIGVPLPGAEPLTPHSALFQQLLSDPCSTHLFAGVYARRSNESEADRAARVAQQKSRRAMHGEEARAKSIRV